MSVRPQDGPAVSAPGVGSRIRVTCAGPAHGGEMVARYEGRVIFVSGALPGEDVTIEITQNKKSFSRGHVIDIHAAHPERGEHVCPAATAGAGCCSWDSAAISLQREMKAQIVEDLLHGLGAVEDIPWRGNVSVLSDNVTRTATQWRVRQRLSITSGGDVGVRAAHSHQVISQQCSQVVPLLSGSPDEWGIADDVVSLAGTNSELVLAADSYGERHIIALTRYEDRYQASRRARATSRRARIQQVHQRRVLAGSGIARQRVLGREWHLPAEAFWQAHRGAATTYAELIRDRADLDTGEVAWDLYGGCGVFAHALSLATSQPGPIVSVDVAGPAVAAGNATFDSDGPEVLMVESSVGRWLKGDIASHYQTPATVVLDPPRAGAGKDVISAVALHAPRTVLHFGCDAAAFARDIKLWGENGYTLSELQVFDGFPNTPHMECFALLRRLL